nr:retrovirus-related Pol polyprotein from transposon TNT 1-94 [Tanacetum cinerariifolium]
ASEPVISTGTPSSTTNDQDAPSTKALIESYWIKAMQEELNELECLKVLELEPHPNHVKIITLKWICKVKLDKLGEAVAAACYTQNRSLIQKSHNKTQYGLLYDRKPDLSYLRVFGALGYPTNDGEDLVKLKPKAKIGIFVGYTPLKKAF